jgi:two-component system, NarL family, invasion response regulator UvrY
MRILIVDDHPIVRASLRRRLLAAETDTEIVEAATGKEALTLARANHPDLVILDLNLPGIGGFDLIARFIRDTPPPRILVLSMHDDPVFAIRALEAGADGYVSKNAPPAEILEAMARLAKGQSYVGPELAQQLAMWNTRARSHPLRDLSRRDLQILQLLGDGQSIQQIADALGIGYKTVANNCGQIKARLGVKRTAELIRFAVLTRGLSE